MSEASNKVAAIFTASKKAFRDARPQTGGGQSDWPDAGDVDLYVLGYSEMEITVKNKATGEEFPAAGVQFRYEVIPNAEAPDFNPDAPVRQFDGNTIRLCSDDVLGSLPLGASGKPGSGSRGWYERNWGRFRQHLAVILNVDPASIQDPAAEWQAVKEILDGGQKIAVAARIQEDGDFKTEFLRENISG